MNHTFRMCLLGSLLMALFVDAATRPWNLRLRGHLAERAKPFQPLNPKTVSWYSRDNPDDRPDTADRKLP